MQKRNKSRGGWTQNYRKNVERAFSDMCHRGSKCRHIECANLCVQGQYVLEQHRGNFSWGTLILKYCPIVYNRPVLESMPIDRLNGLSHNISLLNSVKWQQYSLKNVLWQVNTYIRNLRTISSCGVLRVSLQGGPKNEATLHFPKYLENYGR